jgi:hypothetical protein
MIIDRIASGFESGPIHCPTRPAFSRGTSAHPAGTANATPNVGNRATGSPPPAALVAGFSVAGFVAGASAAERGGGEQQRASRK